MAVFHSPRSPRWCALALGGLLLVAPAVPAERSAIACSPTPAMAAWTSSNSSQQRSSPAARTTNASCTGWLDSYAERRSRLLREISGFAAQERLAAVHSALHQRLLTGEYQIAASDVRLALSAGDYNCLSSLALYLDLCRAADSELEIWLVRGHVFLRANIEGGSTVVEPGSPQWTSRSVVRRTSARQITPVELLGKFYYNRGVELLRDRQYAEGIELLRTSLALDPADDDARANLVAGLNNWAVEHCRAARYDAAAALIGQGLLLDPHFAPLVANEQLVRAKLAE